MFQGIVCWDLDKMRACISSAADILSGCDLSCAEEQLYAQLKMQRSLGRESQKGVEPARRVGRSPCLPQAARA